MNNLIIFGAKYLIVAPVLILGVIWLKQTKKIKIQLTAAVILAAILALIADKIAGKLYFDPRPFVTENITPLITHSADNGFPSEHTLAAATLSGVLYFYNRRWAAISFILTIAIGWARVAAHVHSPIDIIASLLIGATAGWLGWLGAKRFFRKDSVSTT